MKVYNQAINKFKDKRGGVSIIVALVLFFILAGLMALAIDVGRIYTTKNELQNVADAAALAGAGYLGNLYANMAVADQLTIDFSAERLNIIAIARGVVNKAGGENITIDPNDIIIFNINAEPASGDLRFVGPDNWIDGVIIPDAVRVIARRELDARSAEGPITTFFANMFGIDTANVNADATAALTTLDEVGPGEMNMPIGVSENWFIPEPNCEDTIKFSPTTDSCAGWHNFFDPINASAEAEKLLGFIVDHPTDHDTDPSNDPNDPYADAGCLLPPCGRPNTLLYPAYPDGWLDVYFDIAPHKMPPPLYTLGVESGDSIFEFQGGTISSLFNGATLVWAEDGVTPVPDGDSQMVDGNPTTPAPFFAIFDYFRFRDGIEIGDGISVDTNGDGDDNLTVTDPDEVWSALIPVYEDTPDCLNPNDALVIVGFAVIHVIMPNPPPDSTVTAKIDCNLTFIGGQGGGGTSGNVRGSIPNLVE